MHTTKTLAKEFRVSPRTITRWARQGLLPTVRIGRHYRFPDWVVRNAMRTTCNTLEGSTNGPNHVSSGSKFEPQMDVRYEDLLGKRPNEMLNKLLRKS